MVGYRPRHTAPNSASPIPQESYRPTRSRHVVVLCFPSSYSDVFFHAVCCHTVGSIRGDPHAPIRPYYSAAQPVVERPAKGPWMSIVQVITLALALALNMTLPVFVQHPPAAQTVTKTWTLTLDGDVPPGASFGVEYRDPAGRTVAPLVFCGPSAASDCTGAGTTYTHTMMVPHGFELHFRIFRGQPFSTDFESIQDGWETMIADSTTAVQYRMPADDHTRTLLPLRVYAPMIVP